jgi:hypothetical protein
MVQDWAFSRAGSLETGPVKATESPALGQALELPLCRLPFPATAARKEFTPA